MVGARNSSFQADERFAHIATDPRFKALKRTEGRIKADARWKRMIKDERFTLKASAVDKRGRPQHTSMKEDLRRIYNISDSSSSSEEQESEDDEQESEDDAEQPETEPPSKATKSASKKHKKDSKFEVDIARGKGVETSDSESDNDDIEVDMTSEIEHPWGEVDHDAQRTSDATHRLAVCNMDWDHIRAVDLLMLFNSFKPENGVIISVSIYPSEFGLQRMKEENEKGPLELRHVPAEKTSDSEDDKDELSESHRETLRQYELNRLRYYYAVVVCDSPETANSIYESCDGTEYENSASRLDLRFIPDDMTFDQEPKSVATSLPDTTNYQPAVYTNTALQCSTVKLTWDETPHERVAFMSRNFSKEEMEEQDLAAYLASDTDSGDDMYGNDVIDDSEWRRHDTKCSESGSDHEDEASKIEKFKSLVRSLQDKKTKKESNDVEMEVTWEPGLKEKTEKKVTEKEKKSKKLTPWEEYKHKRKMKKLEKKEAKQQKNDKLNGALSDDDLPDDVDLSDPYFAEELGKLKEHKNAKKNKTKQKKKKIENIGENDRQQHAELDLLISESGKTTENASYRKLAKAHKKKKRAVVEDDVVIDISDPRFKAIYENPSYSIDPSAPEFRKSKAIDAMMEEKIKRRTKDL